MTVGNASTLKIGSGGTNNYTQSGGTTQGTGTITGNVNINGGSIKPGTATAPGTLNISGNYTQTSLGAFDVQLGGLTPGTKFSQLKVSNTAALDGAVNVSLVNGFQPLVGDTFEVMDFASSTGTFASINSLNTGFSYIAIYDPADVRLKVTASPVPGPGSLVVLGIGVNGSRSAAALPQTSME